MSKKALIITSKLVQDHEFIYPFYRLKEAGFEVVTYNGDTKQVLGYFGTKIPPKEEDKLISLDKIVVDEFETIILPGGIKSMEILRLKKDVIKIINEFNKKKKIYCSNM